MKIKNIFSMDDPNYANERLFDPIVDKQTWFNLIFILFLLPVSILFSVPVLIFFIIGIALLPLYIGVPVLNAVFNLSYQFTLAERWLFNHLLKKEIPRISSSVSPELKQVQLIRLHFKDIRVWKRIAFFAIIPPVCIISLILPAILIALAILMVYTPVNAMFGHIKIFSFYQTDSFIEAVFAFFIGFIIWAVLLHLVNYWVNLLNKLFTGLIGR